MMAAPRPFAILSDLARAATAAAMPQLPAEAPCEAPWRGLGFQLGGERLVAAVSEVEEVLNVPALTPLPQVKPWVLGLANLRQRLLTVVDLGAYLGLPGSMPTDERRVLVVRDGELHCGLLVEASLGMQAFGPDAKAPLELARPAFARYVDGAFAERGRYWRVMTLRRVLREQAFFDTAAS